MNDDPDAETQEAVDLAHPVRVPMGQVVVDRDDMNALARQRVQVDRRRGDQGLAFAGPHFGDPALMQHHAADQRHIVLALAQGAPGGFPDNGKRLFHEIVEARALGDAVLELSGLGAQVGIGQSMDLRLERRDFQGAGAHGLDLAVVGRPEETLENAQVECPFSGDGTLRQPRKSALSGVRET